MDLDEIDIKIIRLLQKNCRVKLSEIAEEIGKNVAATRYRILRLFSKGIIRCKAIMDPEKLGYVYDVVIMARVEPGKLGDLESFIKEKKEILFAYAITGVYDICIIAVFEDEKHYLSFIDELHATKCVAETTSFVIIKKIKEQYSISI